MSAVVLFWYKLVVSGAKTLDDVPEKYRELVERELQNNE